METWDIRTPLQAEKQEHEEPRKIMLMDELLAFIQDKGKSEFENDSIQEKELSRDQVEYYIRVYKQSAEKLKEIQAVAEAYKKEAENKANEWAEKESKSIQFRMESIEELLRGHAEKELINSKKSSLSYIEGTIGFRKQPLKFDYDDDILRPYLEKAGKSYLTFVPPKVNHAELRKNVVVMEGKAFLENKLLEGITITEVEPKFSIK